MKKIITIMVALILCIGMSGCSLLEGEIDNRKSEREYCALNEENATVFTYDNTAYVILEGTVEKDMLGAWVGYIQKLAVLDTHCAVLELRELNVSESSMSDLPDRTAYIVPFLNIYENSEDPQELIIDADDGFHKAVPKAQADETASIISYEGLQKEPEEEIAINVKNCTQILYGDSLYQMTKTTINENKLNAYLGVIGTNKVFDFKTNLEIPKNSLKEIEIAPDELSKQGRVDWTYGTVFSITNIDKNQSIAVEINNQYLRADRVQ